ncbi:MAG: hypothetical protein J7M19_09735 [Planctomycetes bacterium]|nr:hypothetical protein [Planctomycetota bacterium]
MYFEKPGEDNTDAALAVALGYLKEGKKHFVVATTRGSTALKFAEAFASKGANLVCVTHSAGFREPSILEVTPEKRAELEALGAKVYTGTILTHSIETSLMGKHQGIYPTYIIAQTLRLFSQGVKVCAEIVMEACDAGLVPEAEEVVAVGGTGLGADTVCLVRSAASKRFLDLHFLELACKPR